MLVAVLLSLFTRILTAPSSVGMEGPKLKDSGADGEAMERVVAEVSLSFILRHGIPSLYYTHTYIYTCDTCAHRCVCVWII